MTTNPNPNPKPPTPAPTPTRYADERLPLPDALQQLRDVQAARELEVRRSLALLPDSDDNMSHATYTATSPAAAALVSRLQSVLETAAREGAARAAAANSGGSSSAAASPAASPAAAALAAAVAATAAASADLTDADRSCVVCMDAPREVRFDPCSHAALQHVKLSVAPQPPEAGSWLR